MSRSTRLSREAWIRAAFRALTAAGPSAVKVEPLARALAVSKGSFYWHFDDLAALKSAMLAHWVEMATRDVVRRTDDESESARERFVALGRRVTAERTDTPYGGLLAESAIRDWARFDDEVGEVVRQVNEARLRYIAALLRETGQDEATSDRNAGLVYGALIGLEFLQHQGLADMEAGLGALMRAVVDDAV